MAKKAKKRTTKKTTRGANPETKSMSLRMAPAPKRPAKGAAEIERNLRKLERNKDHRRKNKLVNTGAKTDAMLEWDNLSPKQKLKATYRVQGADETIRVAQSLGVSVLTTMRWLTKWVVKDDDVRRNG